MQEPHHDLKLHIGCGPIIIPGWVNIDIDHADADVHANITKGLPYTDGSVAFVFAEHFIEHLPRELGVNFLRECLRVLRPGGVMRLSTPDLDVLIDAYISRDIKRWGDLWQPGSACRLLNEAFQNWGHHFIYNRREMIEVLYDAGFSVAQWCAHRESLHRDLLGLEARPFHGELIVEATK